MNIEYTPDLIEQLIDFAEKGNQQRITLANGQQLQGWIMEITADSLSMTTGYHDKVGQDYCLSLTEISTATLEYWDSQQQAWQPFDLAV